MPQAQKMSRGVLADARHVVLPDDIAATSFPSVEKTCRAIGIEFDDWQRELNRAILAKRADGRYAASQVALSICRQAGKTFNVGGLVFADSIINPGTTTVWTAHRFAVSRETFDALRTIAMSPLLERHIDSEEITTAAGNECIPFRNGSRILFKARERGVLRGFSKVSRLVLDEAQILTKQAMSDLAPTMTHGRNPQVIMMGTPPKPADPSEVFRGARTSALGGKTSNLLYIEYSADQDADPDDREQLAKANPSYPHRTTPDAARMLRELLTDDGDYIREALGVWDSAHQNGVIPMTSWSEREDRKSVAVDRFAVGIEVAPDMEWASVTLAGQRADGSWHFELAERQQGSEWVASYVRRLLDANPDVIRGVAVDEKSPTADVLEDLRDEGIRVMSPKPHEWGLAHSRLLEGLVTGQAFHTGQVQMTVAASVAGKRKLADTGLWVFARTSATAEITPIQSSVLALWAAQHDKPRRPLRRAEGRRVVTF